MPYLELHTASAFSFLQGASLPESLVDHAANLGYPALALLDRDGVYGAPRFHRAATHAGIKPIIGAELSIAAPALRTKHQELRTPTPTWLLPLLVESQEGYRNLCRLITRMKIEAPKGAGVLRLEDIDGSTRGLVALAGRELLSAGRYGVGGLLDRLVGTFGRSGVYVELARHMLRDQEEDNQTLIDLAEAFRVPILATNGVRFASPDERPLFDVLTCIHHKTTLDAAGRRLAPNAERYLKSPEAMAALFDDLPRAVQATRELADRLSYSMADLGYRFPDYPVPPGETKMSFLRKIAEVGARERYRPYHDRARRQIARELDLIDKLDLAGYFLIVWDIVNFCRQQDILVQGRGSAANSAVCYSLGITAVDPVGMDLLFERFLSEERGEWPDIDLDLPSGDRRERVIQHVYEKYGRLGAAMTANVITYRGRSAAREVGKVLGLDTTEIDRLAKVMNHFEFVDPGDTLTRHLDEVGLSPKDPTIRLFADLWQRMQDLPRHLGQHSGGMVISQGQLDSVVPLENASMPGRVVIQWDKDDCADMGIVKVDLLGLGMMAVLQDALELINGTRLRSAPVLSSQGSGGDGILPGQPLDLAHLPPDDPDVYRMLQAADTIGVFQVESRAQMATLPRMRPERFYDLVVEVAIIRPGPIVGQMVHPYLNRRAGREVVTYPHPCLEPILARTLGVPLFQEQLLRIAMVVAGFTGGQAEELRRAFGFKRSEKRMKQIEVQLREGMARKGITDEAAEQIVRSITSFALYGFPESHAASFALLAYASAYLKAHYPAAFYAALLNNQPMGFYHPATLVKDAQRRGVRFASIDVERSDWLCTIEPDGTVRLGLRYVNGLREECGRAIATALPASGALPGPERCPKCGCDDRSMLEVSYRDAAHPVERAGPVACTCFCNNCAHDWRDVVMRRRFSSADDLVARTRLRREELQTLAEIGALQAFGAHRRDALWQVERAVRPAGELFDETQPEPGTKNELSTRHELSTKNQELALSTKHKELRTSESPLTPMSLTERIQADYAGTGLTIGPHPMALRRSDLALRGVLRAADLPRAQRGRRVRVAGTVITRQRPGTAKGFVFLTLEDETGIANIIVRPDLYARERLTIIEQPFLLVEGMLQSEEGATSVRAERVQRLDGLPPIAVDSHDFY